MADYPYNTKLPVKTKWPDGPWKNEPDHETWIEHLTGLRCAFIRDSDSGHLYGYVRVPHEHPLHGKAYDDKIKTPAGAMDRPVNVDQDIGALALFRASLFEDVESGETALSLILYCHGGLIFARADDDNGWWFGFDCAHSGDLLPARPKAITLDHSKEYRDVVYVRGQCERLAQQIAAVADGRNLATTPEVSAAVGRKTRPPDTSAYSNNQQPMAFGHKEPIMRKYQISIQRRQGDGRWKELFAWEVITLEGQKDQESALNVGLREGWRAKVAEVAKRPQAPHGVPDVSPGANNQPDTSNW